MRTRALLMMLMIWGAAGNAANVAKSSKPGVGAKLPALQKLSCTAGPNDEQVRLIVTAVKGRVHEFAFYSRLGTHVCSIHARRGDALTKWSDAKSSLGHAVVTLRSGAARVAYKPDHVVLEFLEVERMPYCGMEGELNGSVELIQKKATCNLAGIFKDSGMKEPQDSHIKEDIVPLKQSLIPEAEGQLGDSQPNDEVQQQLERSY